MLSIVSSLLYLFFSMFTRIRVSWHGVRNLLKLSKIFSRFFAYRISYCLML